MFAYRKAAGAEAEQLPCPGALAADSRDLVSSPESGFSTTPPALDGEVTAALRDLAAAVTSDILPARRLTNPLLDLWALAHQIDPDAARPVESLLTALQGRELVTAVEIDVTIDQVRSAVHDAASRGGPRRRSGSVPVRDDRRRARADARGAGSHR